MRTLFIADDGKEFDNEKECKQYEDRLLLEFDELNCIFCGGILTHGSYDGNELFTDGGEYLECKCCNTIIKREGKHLHKDSIELMRAYKEVSERIKR